MSYQEALKAAGAEVLAYEEFGSYQGDWWAKVRYKGEVGWAQGGFGSCSGCDAFQAEFGWVEDDAACNEHEYYPDENCTACQQAKKDYLVRLADFGKTYLEGILSQEKAEAEASRDLEWDSDAEEMVSWLKANSI